MAEASAELEKFEELTKILQEPSQKAIYEKWIKFGFPRKQSGGRDGKLFSFFKENFGLEYGDDEAFDAITREYLIYLKTKKNPEPEPVQKSKPTPEQIEQMNAEILQLINSGRLFEIKDDKYTHSKLIKKLIKMYKYDDEHLSDEIKKYIKENLNKFIETKYEITKGKYIDKPSDKIFQYTKKLQKLEYLIKFPRNELERKKAIQMKNDIEEKIKKEYMKQYYKKLDTNDNFHYVQPAQLNSYVPNKFIPLYVKNKFEPGYHRITGEEIAALKQDTSGDYYEGNGIEDIFNKYKLPKILPDKKYIKKIHPIFDPSNSEFNGLMINKLKNGKIIGLPHFGPRPVIKPDTKPFIKPFIKPVIKPDIKPFIKPVVNPLDTPESSIDKHISGSGGTFTNTNYKPHMVMVPFSIGW